MPVSYTGSEFITHNWVTVHFENTIPRDICTKLTFIHFRNVWKRKTQDNLNFLFVNRKTDEQIKVLSYSELYKTKQMYQVESQGTV